ncbi:MAG: DoxX family membrane protein [Chloroflexales bacterium]|nr:DoxX family membrane protein [Chloroflexales bacterium]
MYKQINRIVLGLSFIAAGLNHFRHPRFYTSIMPDYMPWHGALVALSGYAEVLLGVLVLIPRFQKLARWGLIALLVAVFPANIHMALHPQRYQHIPRWALWLRLPFQGVLAAWVWRSTIIKEA